ncbi:MAG: endonuclease/exonuclease/phosphatase family protein [Burkholderiales bacterium]|nr:endonuclease/exonuclease/phosphatase family protein [Burkholderiales bacterium]
MQQEIRFATFNVRNLALPGTIFYSNLPPYTQPEYDAKLDWIARQLDTLDADVIGFQEIFSQTALKEVLARTQKYRNAHHAGFDPDPALTPLTPSVALVSRLPFAAAPAAYVELPSQLVKDVPPMDKPMTRFMRPVLHAPILAPNGVTIHAFVVHLKSKRPDFLDGEDENAPYLFDLASLRSLYRRGVEAIGLRQLITGFMQSGSVPLLVMGDFNDVADSVTTELVMGIGRFGEDDIQYRLYDAYRIQSERALSRDVGYTHMHDGAFNTIDHVLVSKELHPGFAGASGKVIEVTYLNDHVMLRQPEATDHGLVRVTIQLIAGQS